MELTKYEQKYISILNNKVVKFLKSTNVYFKIFTNSCFYSKQTIQIKLTAKDSSRSIEITDAHLEDVIRARLRHKILIFMR